MSEATTARLDGYSAAQLAALTAEAEGWKPEDGDELQGVVVAVKIGTTDASGTPKQYPIVFVLPMDDDTCVAVHAFQAILENEVKSQKPMPGEEIYVKRIGPGAKNKPGQSPPIRYAVHVTREQGTSDPYASL